MPSSLDIPGTHLAQDPLSHTIPFTQITAHSSAVFQILLISHICAEIYRGAWQATVLGVTKSWTRLKQLSMQAAEMLPPRRSFLHPLN